MKPHVTPRGSNGFWNIPAGRRPKTRSLQAQRSNLVHGYGILFVPLSNRFDLSLEEIATPPPGARNESSPYRHCERSEAISITAIVLCLSSFKPAVFLSLEEVASIHPGSLNDSCLNTPQLIRYNDGDSQLYLQS